MLLQEKYKTLIDQANGAGINDLQVREQDGVLYIDGTAAAGKTKDDLWATYAAIDPDFTGGDLVLNIKTGVASGSAKLKVTTESDNLNIRKGPGTNYPVVGKAARHEIVDLISQPNEQWWLVRTAAGEEGYAYAFFLSPE
jgi:uncharacterized protein YgiM (DUF1202 family)